MHARAGASTGKQLTSGQHCPGTTVDWQTAFGISGGAGQVCLVQVISGGVEQTHSSHGSSDASRSPKFIVSLPNMQTASLGTISFSFTSSGMTSSKLARALATELLAAKENHRAFKRNDKLCVRLLVCWWRLTCPKSNRFDLKLCASGQTVLGRFKIISVAQASTPRERFALMVDAVVIESLLKRTAESDVGR